MSRENDEYQSLMQQKRYREAAQFAEDTSARLPGQSSFWQTRQAHACNRNRDFGSALEVARKVLALDASQPYAVIAAADALAGMEKYDEALSYYRETVHHDRLGTGSRIGVLKCLLGMKRWHEALSHLEERELPDEEHQRYKAKALAGMGRIEEAAELCRRWLQQNPHSPGALWELSKLEVEIDGMDAVLGKMSRMARIPSLPPVYGEIYASLCRRAGKPELALAQYEKLEATGSRRTIQRQKAFTLAKSGQEREAVELIEELLRSDPRDVFLHSSYGAACERIGELERAINFYQSLLGLHPEQKSLYGKINRLRGKLEKGL